MTLKLNKETLRSLNASEETQVAAGMPPASFYYSCQDPCYTDNCTLLRTHCVLPR
jgi:hypothetical protein